MLIANPLDANMCGTVNRDACARRSALLILVEDLHSIGVDRNVLRCRRERDRHCQGPDDPDRFRPLADTCQHQAHAEQCDLRHRHPPAASPPEWRNIAIHQRCP